MYRSDKPSVIKMSTTIPEVHHGAFSLASRTPLKAVPAAQSPCLVAGAVPQYELLACPTPLLSAKQARDICCSLLSRLGSLTRQEHFQLSQLLRLNPGLADVQKIEGSRISYRVANDRPLLLGGIEDKFKQVLPEQFSRFFQLFRVELQGNRQSVGWVPQPRRSEACSKKTQNFQTLMKMKALLDKANQIIKKVEGKDILLLVGKTGTGKSTTIYLLLNKKLVAVDKYESKSKQQQICWQEQEQSKSVSPKVLKLDSAEQQIEGVRISSEARAETKYATAHMTQGLGCMIVDTAGLCDTQGVIFDVPNSISLASLIEASRNIKVLVLIHEISINSSEGKGRPLRDLIRQVLNFFGRMDLPNFLKFIKSTGVLITHSEKKMKELHQELKQIKKYTEDKDIALFIDHLINGILPEKNRNMTETFYMVKTANPANFLKEQFRDHLIRRIENAGFLNKEEFNIRSGLKDAEQSFLTKQIFELKDFTQTKAYQFKFREMIDQLDLIKYFAQMAKIREINCIPAIAQWTKQLMVKQKNQFGKTLDLYLSDAGQLSQDSLAYLKRCLTNSSQYGILTDSFQEFECQGNLKNLTDYIAFKFKALSDTVAVNIVKNQQNFTRFLQITKKLAILHQHFALAVPQLQKLYAELQQHLKVQAQKCLSHCVELVKVGHYQKVIKGVQFLQRISPVLQILSNFNLQQQNIQVLVQFIVQSLKFRIQHFKKLSQSLTLESMDGFKQYYQRLQQICKSEGLNNILGNRFLGQSFRSARQLVMERCKFTAKLIQQKLANRLLKQIQTPLRQYTKLRQIDKEVKIDTSDQYNNIKRSIQTEVVAHPKELLQSLLAKLNVSQISSRQLDNSMQSLNQYFELEWIKEYIGQSLERLKNKFQNKLFYQAQERSQILIAKFQQFLRTSEQIKEQFYKQSYQSNLIDRELRFLKALRKNQKLKHFYPQTLKKLNCLIQSNIQIIFNMIEIKKVEIKLDQAPCVKNILKFRALKKITQIKYNVDRVIQKICSQSNQYLVTIIKQLNQARFEKTKRYKQIMESFIKVVDQYKIIDHFVEIYQFKLKDHEQNFKARLAQIFDNLYQEINDDLRNFRIEQLEQKISVINFYKNSNVNSYLKDQLRIKYNQFVKQKQIIIGQAGKQLQSMFSQLRYQQLCEHFTQFKKTKNTKQYKKNQQWIISNVKQEFNTIYQNLMAFEQLKDQQIKKTNSSIRKFFQFEKLGQQILAMVNYPKLSIDLKSLLLISHKAFQNQIREKIDNLELKNIEDLIKKEEKYRRMLLRGLNLTDFGIQNVNLKQTIFQQRIKELMSQDIEPKTIKKAFYNLRKLSLLTNDNSKYYDWYIDKIKCYFNQIIKEFQKKNQLDFGQIQKNYQQFHQFKTNNINLIEAYQQLAPILKKINQIDNSMQIMIQHITKSNKYTEQNFRRLKLTNQQAYSNTILQCVQQYSSLRQCIVQEIRNKNFQRAFKDAQKMVQFQKVEQTILKTQIKIDLQKPSNFIKYVLKQFQIELSKILQECRNIIQSRSLKCQQSLNIITKLITYLQVKASYSSQFLEKLKKFFNHIKQQFVKLIPEHNSKTVLSQLFKKHKIILDHQKIIHNLKRFNQTHQNLLQGINQYLKQKIPYSEQFLIYFLAQVKNKEYQIEELRINNKYRELCNHLIQIKNIGIHQTNKLFENLAIKIRQSIKKKSIEIRANVKQHILKNVSIDLDNLKQAEEEMKGILGLDLSRLEYKIIISQIIENIQKQLINPAKQFIKENNSNQLAQNILKINEWAQNIPCLQNMIGKQTQKLLLIVKSRNLTVQLIKKLDQISMMNETTNPEITARCNQIKSKYTKQLAIPRVLPPLRITIEDAIKKFKTKNYQIDKAELKKSYKLYNDVFESLKSEHLENGNIASLDENKLKVKRFTLNLLSKTIQLRQKIPKMLAGINAYYMLAKSAEQYYNAIQAKKQVANEQLLQPHPIQVLAILIFLSNHGQGGLSKIIKEVKDYLFQIPDKFNNHLMQIKTGEGKSIILGNLSILLALLGYEVYQVCYSQYLSTRDYLDFKDLFADFGVGKFIHYGTFRDIAEQLINQEQDVRQSTVNLFTTNSPMSRSIKSNRNRVLLIDQVDTFFSKTFYGQAYNPSARLRSPEIQAVINCIWQNRNTAFDRIKASYENLYQFQVLQTTYSDCIGKLKQQFELMAAQVGSINSIEYVVKDGQIGYKDLDGVSFDIVHGYKTMFQYLYESMPERGNVTAEEARAKMGVSLTCGQYSYAQMVDRFDSILGVTGTLDCIGEFEENILKRYRIQMQSFAPSVYGDSNRTELPILIEQDASAHFLKIAKLLEQAINKKRAVLVFFQNEAGIEAFKNSPYAERLSANIKVVTQKTRNRDYDIKTATNSKQITLFTSSFGRGTDFVVYHPEVKVEGMAVVQTYLSQEQSEEVQIKGRTARQGQKGTYQLVLNKEDLKAKFKISETDLSKAKQTTGYEACFEQFRKNYMQQINKNREEGVAIVKVIHEKSIILKVLLVSGSIPRSHQFFYTTVQNSVRPSNVCLIFALDESKSMMGQPWKSLTKAFANAIDNFRKSPAKNKIRITVMQFSQRCRIVQQNVTPDQTKAPIFGDGGTSFSPVFNQFVKLAKKYLVDKSSIIKLVFMTDGAAEYPVQPLQQLKLLQLQQRGIIDFTSIGFGVECDKRLMSKITNDLGGKYTTPNNMADLVTVFDTISKEVISCTRCK